MSEEDTQPPRDGVDVRELARELIAENLDLDDIFVDRATNDPADTQASQGEAAHRAAAVQVQRPRSDPPELDGAEKVVLRRRPFRPMRLTSTGIPSGSATRLPSATPHEPTLASLASLSSRPPRRRPLAWLALLLLIGGGAAIAHQALTRAPQESPTP